MRSPTSTIHIPNHTRWRSSASRPMWNVIASFRSRARHNRGACRRHGLETARRRPARSSLRRCFFELFDPLLDAMEMPQEAPPAPRTRSFNAPNYSICIPIAWPKSPASRLIIRNCTNALAAERSQLLDRPHWQLQLCARPKRNTPSTPAKNANLAAHHTCQVLPQSGHSRWPLDPGIYDLTLAARSIVDDNYAYEVWQMANRFSEQQTEVPGMETLNLSGDEVWLRTRKLRIRRRLPRIKQRFKPSRIEPRKREKFQGRMGQTNQRPIVFVPIRPKIW